MAVVVKYVVVRDGKEDMIFSTKKEADAYDKMLDVAERLYVYLQRAEVDISEDQLDALAFFMAQHRDQVGRLLKGEKLEAATAGAKPSAAPRGKADATAGGNQDASSETKGGEASKRPRTTKSKAAA